MIARDSYFISVYTCSLVHAFLYFCCVAASFYSQFIRIQSYTQLSSLGIALHWDIRYTKESVHNHRARGTSNNASGRVFRIQVQFR